MNASVPLAGTAKVTRCVAPDSTRNWTATLVPDPKTTTTTRLRRKQAELVRSRGINDMRNEMDRPSYHVPPDQTIDTNSDGMVHFFDTASGNPYVYTPDESNPEIMAFGVGAARASPKPANLTFFDDRTPLNESDGTIMARVEVPTTWDIHRHYDLRAHPTTSAMELVYETPSKLPFLLFEKGKLRGTGLARIGSANVTVVGVDTLNVANPSTKTTEEAGCLQIAQKHQSCFADMNVAYATCTARLHSASTPQCCGHLFDVGIYVACDH